MKRFAWWTIRVVCLSASVGCSAQNLSPLAVRADDEPYVGRYTGGGAHGGQQRFRHEGTWARDYAGIDWLGLIELRWSHARSFRQGGLGNY